jgi:hypothetical protein
MSAGQLSCLTCHDPHGDAETSPTYYNRRCLSCHSVAAKPARFRVIVCPTGVRGDCVACHMPRDSKSMLYVTFTDHRIRVVPTNNQSGSRTHAADRKAN